MSIEALAIITEAEKTLSQFHALIADRIENIAPGINPVQALLLARLPDEGCFSKTISKEFYYGTNPSYNISKLTEMKYLTATEDMGDRRRKRVKLTESGIKIKNLVLETLKNAEMRNIAA